jgi:hypothetical protein
LTKLNRVVGEFECAVGARKGAVSVVPHYRERAKGYVPDENLHALVDRMAGEQQRLGA